MLAYVPLYANSVGAERWKKNKANLLEDPYTDVALKDLEPMRSNMSHLHNLIQHFYQ